MLVRYSQHSARKIMLWIDDQGPLAARSIEQQRQDKAWFEMAIAVVQRASGSHVRRRMQAAPFQRGVEVLFTGLSGLDGNAAGLETAAVGMAARPIRPN